MKSNRRYGYKDVWEVRDVIANYSAADIPLEAQWIDIDISTTVDCTLGVIKERMSVSFTGGYLIGSAHPIFAVDQWMDFTFDPVRFPLKEMQVRFL